MKAKFKKFLTNNRAYSKFVRNIKSQWRNRNFTEYCDRDENWDRIIYRAFHWRITPEGFSYWNVLNNKWEKLLENEQNTT